MSWFNVDKAGLAAILERRGKWFALAELVSNAWDAGSKNVSVTLEPISGQAYAMLSIEDDGEGFTDLNHANTMFARSTRAGNADKRGRFNLGEKLVLSLCRTASIRTRSGMVAFCDDGTVKRSSQTFPGTRFTAEVRMTRDEYAEACDTAKRLIPPVKTTFNGKIIDRPDSIVTFETKLPTELADNDGLIRRTVRTATVEVYESFDGGGELLELGIPVVETDNGYRVNVLQKVPLNLDRDNVTPAFLKAINAALLNNIHAMLTAEEVSEPWAQEAAGDARATPDAVKDVLVKRFGERAVIATPGDPMANANAAASGFNVIPGGALSGNAWANVRKYNLLTPASKAFPTPTPEDMAKRAEQVCPLCGK